MIRVHSRINPCLVICSRTAVQLGDWLTLDVLATDYNASACFQLSVSEEMIDVMSECSLSVSHDGMTWVSFAE